ncbi:MAG: hydrogenase maturation nickel metallochaperone HypA [Anaerolineales bacterium]|nr:MAG: hydrogenase maturation nickel metallochaperone HypA [Anaerolineales bacterium]
MDSNPRLSSIVSLLLREPLPADSVQLAVGELNDLNEEQLREQWEELVAQTSLAQTTLNIRMIPAELQCMACFLKYHPQRKETVCPQCNSVGAKILAGEEFYLESF